jgi:hypothetical protein
MHSTNVNALLNKTRRHLLFKGIFFSGLETVLNRDVF